MELEATRLRQETSPERDMLAALTHINRARVLEGTADLLLEQVRLHAKRVRATAAAFRRETWRDLLDDSLGIDRVDEAFDEIAQQVTAALTALDAAFTATYADIATLESMLATVDIEQPDLPLAERMHRRASAILATLRTGHTTARNALNFVAEQLGVLANNLAIIIGRPGSKPLNHMRVLIRQMRTLSGITAELGERLDVFIQNQSVTLQALALDDSSTAATITPGSWRRATTAANASRQEGAA